MPRRPPTNRKKTPAKKQPARRVARVAAPPKRQTPTPLANAAPKPRPAKPAAVGPKERGIPVVVGIGASAGGLEALGEMLGHMPVDTGMAFVVVQHLAPAHESLMTDLLARKTGMQVVQARDGAPVEPDCVYVIPPNCDLGIMHGALQLFDRPEERRPHLPVDHFFRSLAQDQGNKAIGVVLSGSGSDGTLGLIAIKAEGGITFAQDPKTAQYDGMPRSAIATGSVDFVRTPADIARELAEIARHPYIRREPAEELVPGGALSKVFFLLRRHTGHDFTHYKRSTIGRRLQRRMLLHKLSRVEDYVRYLEESPAEVHALFHDLLINVTSFFRDADTFEALKATAFPHLFEGHKPEEPLRIWVPGCSTGEEAYSIAMVLVEYLRRDWMTRTIQIFASDIDDKAIEKARAGFYPENIQEHVSDERLRRFFIRKPNGYLISKAIRDLCVFSTQNVIQDPPFSRMDLVCCRNLLIYLDATLQKKVLARLHFALKADGLLVLGTSESISGADELYSVVDKKNKIYAKKSARVPLREFAEMPAAPLVPTVEPPTRRARVVRNLQQEAEHLILRHYGPPAVVINEDMEIVGFSGQTGPYIEPAPGAVSLKLLKMAHPDLSVALRNAVLRAIKHERLTRQENARLRIAGKEQYVSIAVTPLQGPTVSDRYYAVVFEPAGKPAISAPQMPRPRRATERDRRIQELENELEAARGQIQTLVSDYTTAIEELQTSNEEVQSSAEEMQSINEELESAKEELQSTNEELATLNEELESRNVELTQANNDLVNLLSSVNLPMVMLSEDLRIRQFTPMARELLNFIDADIGRPIGDIKPNIDIPDLERQVLDVMESMSSKSLEARDKDGHWHSVRIRPYRTMDNRIAGAVLVCIDISDLKQDLEQAHQLAAAVRDGRDAVALLDPAGRILVWNRGARELYGYGEEEALKMNIRDLIPSDLRGEWDGLLERIKRGEAIGSVETKRVTKDGRTIDVWLTATTLRDRAGMLSEIATIERDITEMKRSLERARRLATVVRDSNDAVLVQDLKGEIKAWNPRAERVYGYSEAEALRMNVHELIPQEGRAAHDEMVQRVLRGEIIALFGTLRVDKDGRSFDVFVTASLLVDEAGRPTGIAMTERAKSEATDAPSSSGYQA